MKGARVQQPESGRGRNGQHHGRALRPGDDVEDGSGQTEQRHPRGPEAPAHAREKQ